MSITSPISQWRNHKNRYSLYGDQCTTCQKTYYPKGYYCQCGSLIFTPLPLSGHGKLLSFTEITTAPKPFEQLTPYCIGIIELEEGVKLTAQITDCTLQQLYIGIPVEASFRKMFQNGTTGIIHYGIKFKPKTTISQ